MVRSFVVEKQEPDHKELEDSYKEPEVAVVVVDQLLQLPLLQGWLDYGFVLPFVDWGESIVAPELVVGVHSEGTETK